MVAAEDEDAVVDGSSLTAARHSNPSSDSSNGARRQVVDLQRAMGCTMIEDEAEEQDEAEDKDSKEEEQAKHLISGQGSFRATATRVASGATARAIASPRCSTLGQTRRMR